MDGAEAGELHALYERVALRGDVQFEVFTKEYFVKLAERMPDQARYFIWRHAGRVVAFCFCTVHGDTIYDNDLGLDEATASALGLYHVTFRDIVRWALAHGLRRYESCPFNYHPKLHLRMDLVPLDLYARHTSPPLNVLLRWLAPLAAPTRQEPLLKEFRQRRRAMSPSSVHPDAGAFAAGVSSSLAALHRRRLSSISSVSGGTSGFSHRPTAGPGAGLSALFSGRRGFSDPAVADHGRGHRGRQRTEPVRFPGS